MIKTMKHRTPADALRAAAKWIERNAYNLVAGDGFFVTEDGLDLDVTIHLEHAAFTTVTVAGTTEYIVQERTEDTEP